MFIYYTVNPEPASFPKAYIVRIFKDKNDETRCLKTVSFPILNPSLPNKTKNEAAEFGRLFVKQMMDKEFSHDGRN